MNRGTFYKKQLLSRCRSLFFFLEAKTPLIYWHRPAAAYLLTSYPNFFIRTALQHHKFAPRLSTPYNFFFSYFFNNFFLLKFLDKTFISLRNSSFSFFEKSRTLLFLYRAVRRFASFLKIRMTVLKSILKFFLFFFYYADSCIFTSWLKQLCEGSSLKNHRAIFTFLKFFLSFFFKKFYSIFTLRGFYLQIKGKISSGGNSKKRRSVIKAGSYNLSDNSLRISYSKAYIRTFSGVLGVLFYVCF